MQLPTSLYYAFKATLYLYRHPNGIATIREIAQAERLRSNTLAKVVQKLAQGGNLLTHKGPKGGVALSHPELPLTLLQLAEALSGPVVPGQCPLGVEDCLLREVCRHLSRWQEIHRSLAAVLGQIRLSAEL